MKDVFAIESEIAQTIASELQITLTEQQKAAIEEKPTKDLAAYDFYLRARNLLDYVVASETTAISLLEQALKRDPNFVLAYCQLALAHDDLYFFGIDRTPQRLALTKEAI